MFPVYYRFAALFVFASWTKTINPHLEFLIWTFLFLGLFIFSWVYLYRDCNNGEVIRIYGGYGEYYSHYKRDWRKFGRNYAHLVLGIET